MVLLAVDIGNSSTTVGLYDGTGILLNHFDIPTRTLTHRDLMREALEAPLKDITTPDIIGLASVVPWASDEVIVVLHEIFPTATVLLITSNNIPIQIDYPNPDELGTDRLLGALAAYRMWGEREKRPCIVIDLGTATTYDCITADGVFLGGAIAPGLELGAEALTQRTAQLPSIELAFPSSIIGRTTVESIQSGIMYGGLAQIEGFVAQLRKAAFAGEEPIVVMTGGLSRLIEGRASLAAHFKPSLILEGIRIAVEEHTVLEEVAANE